MMNKHNKNIAHGLTQRDKDVESVLQYLNKHRYGYLRDLDKLNKPDIIFEMICIGMLKTGFTRDGETFAITPFGMLYYNVLFASPKTSFLYRLVNRIPSR